MTIESTAVVDFIGVNKDTGRVVLTIVDHLEWSRDIEERHLKLLQDKINTYLRFIESGELISEYPDAKKRDVEISLVFKHEMSESGRFFFDEATRILADSQIILSQEVFEADDS
jgi:hypothetical protein